MIAERPNEAASLSLLNRIRLSQSINIWIRSIDIMPTSTNAIPANKNSFIFRLGGMPTLSVGYRAKSVLRIGFCFQMNIGRYVKILLQNRIHYGIVSASNVQQRAIRSENWYCWKSVEYKPQSQNSCWPVIESRKAILHIHSKRKRMAETGKGGLDICFVNDAFL